MKSFLALAVLVSVALANSTGFYGWQPHQELKFRFESQQLSGIPEIANQWAGLKLTSEVIVQTFSDYSLRIAFKNPKFIQVNKQLQVVDGKPVIPQATQELPEELSQALQQPFEAHLKRGVVEAFFIESDEPVVVTNIKRALLSQLQMDLTASRRAEIASNVLPKSEQAKEGQVSYFSTEERTVLGDCQTSYTVTPVPAYLAKEMESRWNSEEKAAQKLGLIAEGQGPKSRAPEVCRDQQYYEIVKTTNFDNCREMPVYTAWTGVKGACDVTKSGCKDMLTHLASTRYVVCGQSAHDFVIRQAKTTDTIVSQPIAWQTGAEKITTTSTVSLYLIDAQKSGYQPLPKPQSAQKKQSLVFQYPKGSQWSSQASTKEITPEQESQGEYAPILEKPSLHQPSLLFPSPLPASEIKSKVVQKVLDITRELFSEPSSQKTCSHKSDVAGNIATVAIYLRPLNYQQLQQLYSEIEQALNQQQPTKQAQKVGMEIFRDILAMSGSNPTVTVLLQKIQQAARQGEQQNGQNGQLSKGEASLLMASVLRNVRTPTEELLKEILRTLKNIKQSARQQGQQYSTANSVYSTGIAQFSNLVYKACVDPSTSMTNFPVRIYGQFCRNSSEVITEELIPYLAEQMESASRLSESLTYVNALSKIGTKETLIPLAKAIQGKLSSFIVSNPNAQGSEKSPMARSIAVYGLKRLAQRQPALVRPVLMSLVDNVAENTQVRIAAVAILPWTQPSVAELQKIAVRSWFEPSTQVASFIYSTLKALPHTQIPELKPVGVKASTVANLVKPFQYGIQYSQNLQSNQFVPYLRVGSNALLNYVITEDSAVPAHLSIASTIYGGLWEVPELNFALYTQGMDHILDRVIDIMGWKSETSSNVQQQLQKINEQLGINQRKYQDKAAVFDLKMLGLERFYALDKDNFHQMVEKVSQEMRRMSQGSYDEDYSVMIRRSMSQNTISVEAYGPSASGFPLYVQKIVPVVMSAKGQIRLSGSTSVKSSNGNQMQIPNQLYADITPSVNAKIETNMGVISPFTKEFLGTGAEICIHAAAPAQLKIRYSRHQGVSVSLKNEKSAQSQSQMEVFHAFVKPYTVTKKISQITPLAKSENAREILSGNKLVEKNWNIGQSYGLSAQAQLKTDYTTLSLAGFIEKASQHNIMSAISSGTMVPSVRYLSLKGLYSPAQSETKEIKTDILFKSANQPRRSLEQQGEEIELEQGQQYDSEREYYVSAEQAEQHQLENEVKHACEQSYRSKAKAARCAEKRAEQVQQLADSAEEACETAEENEYVSHSEKKSCRKAQKVCRIAQEICQEAAQEEEESQYQSYGTESRAQRKSQECRQAREECLNRRYTIHRMEKVARQVKQSHSVSGLHIQSQLIQSEYSSGNDKTFQIIGVAAASKQPSLKQKNSAMAQIIVVLPQQGKYQATIELQSRVPRIPFRWSLSSLLSEPINMWNKISLTYGPGSSNKGAQQNQAELELNWTKTENQQQYVQRSAEWEKCQEEAQLQRPLTSVCIETRHMAASVDKVHAKALIPRSWTHSSSFQKFASLVKGYYMPNLAQNIMDTFYQTEQSEEEYNQYEQEQGYAQGQLNAEAELYFAHNGDSIKKVEILAPARLSLKNIRLPAPLQGFAPLSLRNGVLPRLIQKVTRNQAPASCRIQPNFVSTFDNRTYSYQLNSCEHLLFKDCSGRRPIAVLAEASQHNSAQQKNMKVLSGNYVIYVQAKSFQQGQQVQIQVNGSPVTLQYGQQPRVWHSRQTGQPDLEIMVSKDGVLSVRNLIDGLQVFYNGKSIEIVAPQNMHNRACGLCGDLNLENTADVKTPKQCVLKEDRFNAYSYMSHTTIRGQSCSGIPSSQRAQYEREISSCSKAVQVPTPVIKLAQALRSSGPIKPISMKHLIKQEQNQACFSKQRVLVCTGNSEPSGIKTAELQFVCLSKPSSKAEQLTIRANAGEILPEIRALPTVFLAKRQVPTKCVSLQGEQVEEEMYDNYRNSPRY